MGLESNTHNIINRGHMFKEFFLFNEIFDNPHEPLNAVWDDKDEDAVLFFDVKGSKCQNSPCHMIYFVSKGDGGVSIGFKPRDGNYDDRGQFDQNEIGNAVTYAVDVYINSRHPEYITWMPSQKTSTDRNKDARKKIYAIGMQRRWFPKYVPVDNSDPDYPSVWARRDIYEKHYISKGYPDLGTSKLGDRKTNKDILSKIANANKQNPIVPKHSGTKHDSTDIDF